MPNQDPLHGCRQRHVGPAVLLQKGLAEDELDGLGRRPRLPLSSCGRPLVQPEPVPRGCKLATCGYRGHYSLSAWDSPARWCGLCSFWERLADASGASLSEVECAGPSPGDVPPPVIHGPGEKRRKTRCPRPRVVTRARRPSTAGLRNVPGDVRSRRGAFEKAFRHPAM